MLYFSSVFWIHVVIARWLPKGNAINEIDFSDVANHESTDLVSCQASSGARILNLKSRAIWEGDMQSFHTKKGATCSVRPNQRTLLKPKEQAAPKAFSTRCTPNDDGSPRFDLCCYDLYYYGQRGEKVEISTNCWTCMYFCNALLEP